ncbi:MAG: glycosyltransferase family 4 protein [Candidatus Heimdallarchaeota archaeon]|nr:glycosyltransferase family 4 protein [Candidatus Heimdallarchaeota archaeon]MCK4953784.1 glycosyltransferase family 4 protein [Candidatus Heimdallarchaeota archaeon]
MPLNIAMLFELGPDDNGSIGGGVELHAINLSKELVKQGHEVTFITGAIPECKEKYNIDGVEIRRLELCSLIKSSYNPQKLNFSRQAFFLMKALLSRQKKIIENESFDIFHGHVYSAGIAAYILAKKQSAKFINTIHGSYYKHWKQITKNRASSFFYRRMERSIAPYLAKKSDFQIHTDYDFADTVKKWCKLETQNKIVTVLNGVDIKKFSPDIKPDPMFDQKKGPKIIATRRLVAKNGVIFLVRSFKEILKKFPSAELFIIGDGPEKQRLETESKLLGIHRQTHFIGMVPNDRIPSFLAAADIVVVPSIVEASSISVLEAMSMKKPIVASNIPGIREISDYGKNCELVSPMNWEDLAKGITKLLNDEEKAEDLARLGFEESTKNFTWEKKAKEIEQLYYRTQENNSQQLH